MSGPFVPARAAQPFDLLEKSAAGGGWEGLEEIFKPILQEAPLQPGDDVARFMWGLANTPEGRAMFEWMMDISLRQPFRAVGQTIEQTALAAATRQGINGFAEAVLAAIAHGEKQVREARQKS